MTERLTARTMRGNMNHRSVKIDWGEAIIPAIAMLFGIAFFWQTMDAPKDALFWPFITAGVTLVFWFFAVRRFVVHRRSKMTTGSEPAATPSLPTVRTRGRIALILSTTIGYLLVIPHLGFLLTNFVFMLVVFRGLGSRRWRQNLAVAAGIAILLHVALVVLMKQELPRLSIGGLTL